MSPSIRLGLMMRVGVANALLATVLSALLIATFSGTGTDGPALPVSATPQTVEVLPAPVRYPWEVAKATLLLCPITFGCFGWFGFLAGGAAAALFLYLRRGIRSTINLVLESALAGFLLGAIFPWIDAAAIGPEFAFSPACGAVCGSICAAVFRKELLRWAA